MLREKSPARARWLGWAAGLVVAGACVVARARSVVAFGPSDFDDAYMYLRYARLLLAGHGLAWNPGEAPVFGVTSPVHLLVVTALRATTALPDGRLLQVASCGMGLLAALALALVCARFARHPALHRRWGPWLALVVPAVTLTEPFEFHARTGMDTTLSLLANTALVFAALRLAERPGRGRALAAAVVAVSAVAVRPDNAVVALGCPLLLLWWHAPATRDTGRAAVIFAATFGILVALGLVGARGWLGTALPLAFTAKQPGAYAGFAGEYGWNPWLFLLVFLQAALPFAALLLVLVDRGRWRVAAALLLPAMASIGFFFWVNQIMGHLGRFYFPFLPFLVVAAALTADDAWADRRAGALAWRVAIAAAVVLAAGPILRAAGRRFDARAQAQPLADIEAGYTAAPLPELDSWRASHELAALAAAAPPGTVIAMSEHGLAGAQAIHVTIVDLLGLHDRAFARDGFTAPALWARRPDAIWMPHPDHTGMIRAILDSPELWRDHDFYPGAFTYGLAIRRDRPALQAAFAARWRAVYPGRPLESHRAHPTGR